MALLLGIPVATHSEGDETLGVAFVDHVHRIRRGVIAYVKVQEPEGGLFLMEGAVLVTEYSRTARPRHSDPYRMESRRREGLWSKQ